MSHNKTQPAWRHLCTKHNFCYKLMKHKCHFQETVLIYKGSIINNVQQQLQQNHKEKK